MNKRYETLDEAQLQAVIRAKEILGEHFDNLAIFINWVGEDGLTRRGEVFSGNSLAIEYHVGCWLDGEYDIQGASSDGESSMT